MVQTSYGYLPMIITWRNFLSLRVFLLAVTMPSLLARSQPSAASDRGPNPCLFQPEQVSENDMGSKNPVFLE